MYTVCAGVCVLNKPFKFTCNTNQSEYRHIPSSVANVDVVDDNRRSPMTEVSEVRQTEAESHHYSTVLREKRRKQRNGYPRKPRRGCMWWKSAHNNRNKS